MSRFQEQWRQFHRTLDRYMTAGVKWLILANVAVFLVEFILMRWEDWFLWLFAQNPIVRFADSPVGGYDLQINVLCTIQFFTYMFVHGDFGHLFWNMLLLWFFGPPLETRWGTVRFLKFYCFTGFAAGALHGLLAPLLFAPNVILLGASGAVFGVLVAFAVCCPDQHILLWFVLPIRARTLVIVLGCLAVFYLLTGVRSEISHLTHLAGLGFGYLWVRLHALYPHLWLFSEDPGPFSRLGRRSRGSAA